VATASTQESGLELLDPHNPTKFIDLGAGDLPLWGKPGIAEGTDVAGDRRSFVSRTLSRTP